MTNTAVAVRDEMAEIVRVRASSGFLRIYGGRENSDLLAELRLGQFTASEGGTFRSEPESISSDPSAKSTGKATWYRIAATDGDSLVWEGDVSDKKGKGSLKLDSVEIHQGADVSVLSITYSVP